MSARVRDLLRTRLRAIGLLVLGAAVLGGCGTPAAVRPVATPLPGFQRDIQAAKKGRRPDRAPGSERRLEQRRRSSLAVAR
jgi:hypothetical protein